MEPITELGRAVQLDHGDARLQPVGRRFGLRKSTGMAFLVSALCTGPTQGPSRPPCPWIPSPPSPSLRWSSVRLTTHFHVAPPV